jgi:hypothetical protein
MVTLKRNGDHRILLTANTSFFPEPGTAQRHRASLRKPSPRQSVYTYFKVMKWFLAAAVVAVLAAFAYLQANSVKTTYVNGLAPYTTIPGREYIVEHDCYVFKFKEHNTDWPLLAAHDTVAELPDVVSDSKVGADLPLVRILDVIHVGDHFRIASVRRDVGRSGTRITFEALLFDEATRKFPRIDLYWIMDHSPEKMGAAPTILPAYAVPLRRE